MIFLTVFVFPDFAQDSSFDDQFVSSEEYTKLMDRLFELENQAHLHSPPMIGYLGIFLSFMGFILMLRYWSHPYERHLENWIKFIKVIYPNSYEKRIKRDFNYWRDYRDKEKPSPHGEWFVPKGFAWYWHIMKYGALFSIIVGFFFQIFQLEFL